MGPRSAEPYPDVRTEKQFGSRSSYVNVRKVLRQVPSGPTDVRVRQGRSGLVTVNATELLPDLNEMPG